jgi:hypothetical protein
MGMTALVTAGGIDPSVVRTGGFCVVGEDCALAMMPMQHRQMRKSIRFMIIDLRMDNI